MRSDLASFFTLANFLDRISDRNVELGIGNRGGFLDGQNDAPVSLELGSRRINIDGIHGTLFFFSIFVCNGIFILCHRHLLLSGNWIFSFMKKLQTSLLCT